MIINIETSTEVCSVSITQGDEVLFGREDRKGPSHTTLLGGYVQQALAFCQHKQIVLDAVAVSAGPGSYTGLRIGVSMAKGLCFGYGIPLIAVETLRLMATIASTLVDDPMALLCPMIDARRMEVYSAIYDKNLNNIKATSADVIAPESYKEFLDCKPLYLGGNGAAKCLETLAHPNLRFIDSLYPTALKMGALSQEQFDQSNWVDVAYFEPLYLKEFIVTTPKSKIIQQYSNHESTTV